MEGKQILIIDDDAGLVKLMKLVFEGKGAEVATATGGEEGLRLLWQRRPDLVILDIMMPQMNGWEVCRRIRELSDVPLIFLTALQQEEDIVRGLSLGADDYVGKPMKPAVLLARANALLRRRTPQHPQDLAFDDGYLCVDLEKKRVEIEGRPVKLTRTEFALLNLLVRNAGRITPMDQIRQRVWGGTGQVSPQTIHVFISQLRKKIEPDPGEPRYIISEYGMGYRFP